jgi:AhpD family alkylhydroperoxidase
MSNRGTYHQAKTFKGLRALSDTVDNAGLDPLIYELIKIRASQINGCSLCLNMHIEDALKIGERQQRINLLSVWRDTPLFSERERAALALTEAVTLISENHVPDDVFNEARRLFSEDEIADLTLAIITINAWNRMNITFGIEVQEPAAV